MITRDVICKAMGSRQGLFVRQGDLVKDRSLEVTRGSDEDRKESKSCISPSILVSRFSSGSFHLGEAP